jgi:hypothetical protein
MPASDVIEKAKAAGFSLSKGYVYVIRSKANGGGRKAARGSDATRSRRPVTRSGGNSQIEAQLIDLVLDLGLAKSEALLKSIRTKLKHLA